MDSRLEALARGFYESLNARDVDGILRGCDAAVEFDWSESLGSDNTVFRGRRAVRRFIEENLEMWSDLRMDPEEIVELGEGQALVLVRVRMRGRDGVEVEARGAHVATFRGDKLLSYRLFQTPADAFAALALKRPPVRD